MTTPHDRGPGHWPEARRPDGTVIGEFVTQEIADEHAGLAAEIVRLRKALEQADKEPLPVLPRAPFRADDGTFYYTPTQMHEFARRHADIVLAFVARALSASTEGKGG